MICVDLMNEWLWEVRYRVKPAEYIICLLTFACCMFMAVETGICCGIAIFIACKRFGLDVGEGQQDADEQTSKEVANTSNLSRKE